MDPREVYEANLDLIERIISVQCRRSACYGPDAEDFRSEVHVKLLENDGHRLGQCQDLEGIKAFLITTVAHLFLDYRNHKWGKFRVSAVARRLGSPAVELETLLRRDGWDLEEAIRILRQNLGFESSADELRQLAETLSDKPRRRFESDQGLERMAVQGGAADLAEDRERAREAESVREVLERCLQALEAEERLLLKMRFRDGLMVSVIARLLERNQRRLYTELDKLFRSLKACLSSGGSDAESSLAAIGWDGWGGLLDGEE